MFLLLVAVTLVYAQTGSTLLNAYDSRVTLTKQQSPAYPSSGLPTADERNFVFRSSSEGFGTKLYSTSSGSVNINQQTLLSQANFANGAGVSGNPTVSPDGSFVLWNGRVQSTGGNTDQYSVGINGGAITRITPPIASGMSTSLSINAWRPCAGGCSGLDTSQWLGTYSTTVGNCQVSCSGVPELWSQTRSGNNVRLNVPLFQGAGLPVTKFVARQTQWSDFVLYLSNPGSNEQFDTRRAYISDWNGNNWQVSLSNTQATFANSSSASFLRSVGSCGANGKYLASLDNYVTNNYRSLSVYDLDAKRVLGTGTLNVAFDVNTTVSLVAFSPDQTKLYYIANPAGTFNTNLYELDLSSSSFTNKVVNPTPFPSNTTSTAVLTGPTWVGDYFLFTVTTVGLATDVETALYTYNYKTGAAPILLHTSPRGVTPALSTRSIFDAAGSKPTGGPTSFDNTAYVWFFSNNSRELWIAPVTGAGATQILIDTLHSFTSNPVSRVCSSPLDTDFCKLNTQACTCSGCGTQLCGGYTWLYLTYNGTETRLYSIAYNGQNIRQITPATSDLLGLSNQFSLLANPNSVDNVPTLVFLARTGSLTNNTQDLYIHKADTAAAVKINTVSPQQSWNGGAVRIVQPDPTSTWITYQINPDTNFPGKWELYIVKADGSAAATKLNPNLIYGTSTDHAQQTVGSVRFTPSGKYLTFLINDFNSNGNLQRGQLWAYQVGGTVNAQNLTVISNASRVDSIPNTFDINSVQFHCNQETLIYQTNLPEFGSPTGIFSVPLKGGNTVALAFDPNSGGSITQFGVFKSSFRVWFTSNYFGTNNDLFVNTASAAFLLPSLALLFLALFL